ncbi:MAG TPA: trehalose operon repressor, partial [Lactobacillus johnsonii]|nr:trehalose operon repressor [Lactobacillus johnsonii]
MKVSAFIYLDLNIILVCTSCQYIFMKKLTFLLNQYFIIKNVFLYLSNQV